MSRKSTNTYDHETINRISPFKISYSFYFIILVYTAAALLWGKNLCECILIYFTRPLNITDVQRKTFYLSFEFRLIIRVRGVFHFLQQYGY